MDGPSPATQPAPHLRRPGGAARLAPPVSGVVGGLGHADRPPALHLGSPPLTPRLAGSVARLCPVIGAKSSPAHDVEGSKAGARHRRRWCVGLQGAGSQGWGSCHRPLPNGPNPAAPALPGSFVRPRQGRGCAAGGQRPPGQRAVPEGGGRRSPRSTASARYVITSGCCTDAVMPLHHQGA